MKSNENIANTIDERKTKIKKYEKILFLKKKLEKIENNQKFFKDIEDRKIKEVDDKDLNLTFNKKKSMTENTLNYDKLINILLKYH